MLTEKIQAEAAQERELSAALRNYAEVVVSVESGFASVERIGEAGSRVLSAEIARNVGRVRADGEWVPLADLVPWGRLTELAEAVRKYGALRGYESQGFGRRYA